MVDPVGRRDLFVGGGIPRLLIRDERRAACRKHGRLVRCHGCFDRLGRNNYVCTRNIRVSNCDWGGSTTARIRLILRSGVQSIYFRAQRIVVSWRETSYGVRTTIGRHGGEGRSRSGIAIRAAAAIENADVDDAGG